MMIAVSEIRERFFLVSIGGEDGNEDSRINYYATPSKLKTAYKNGAVR